MTIKDLIDTLQRPVDYIAVGTGYMEDRHELYSYDGFEAESIPEPISNLTVEKWEVEAECAQISLGEIQLLYNLVITI